MYITISYGNGINILKCPFVTRVSLIQKREIINTTGKGVIKITLLFVEYMQVKLLSRFSLNWR
jgi:hypothetical protein